MLFIEKYISVHNSPRSRILPKELGIENIRLEKSFSPIKSIYQTPLNVDLKKLPSKESVLVEYDGNIFFNLWLVVFLKLRLNKVILDCHNSAIENQTGHFTRYLLNRIYLFSLDKISFVKIIVHNHAIQPRFIRSEVLETPYPKIPIPKLPNSNFDIVFCCSLNSDEPLDRILKWCRELKIRGKSTLITGNYNKVKNRYDSEFFSEDFLSYNEYIEILAGCKLSVALTTREDTLLFSPRESIVLKTSCLINNSSVNRDFYGSKVSYLSLNDSDEQIVDNILSLCK